MIAACVIEPRTGLRFDIYSKCWGQKKKNTTSFEESRTSWREMMALKQIILKEKEKKEMDEPALTLRLNNLIEGNFKWNLQ